ncbi:RagB/SusD family nutrient uptake outer membrane protein [Segatella albensis]|uniref:RagB/SusD family nutrient uptake outer membrane protein n=1 Tax=Segatella albensis TaxID=77768 RepID=UPI000ABEAC44|nr:RagB/SusD family nutrient uptake outer membrane protein [Segatella albensis]
MKIKKIFYSTLTLAFAGMTLISCNDFLDKMPDNRATIDTDDEAISLLTSAYPENDYMMVGEFMSDNVDDYGANNPYTDRFIDQVYHWQDVTEDDSESPEEFWQASYKAIANANQALASIEEMGANKSEKLSRAKGEALLCRAYNHFMLTNMFCKNYNDTTSNKDLGIPYMEAPETTLYPKYSRGTVAEDYEKIETDLLEGLSLVAMPTTKCQNTISMSRQPTPLPAVSICTTRNGTKSSSMLICC